FTSDKLKPGTLTPIEFRTPDGRRMLGYEATLLADICDAVLEARKHGALTEKQQHVAAQCEILVRGFARVGIIALVDEATGYQEDRAKNALAKILEAFIAKELRKWVSTFPTDYYKELFRLRGWKFPDLPADQRKRPVLVGKITNDVVYDRLAPGVRQELNRLTPRDEKGRLKHKLFQRLTEDVGHPKLREHLASVSSLMKASDSWDQFKRMLERALPRYGDTPYLPFEG
ncbi:MAG TPA: P63C domain-containing protein, partial [Terriglobales bacterium]|nr:P63C domain-containing protein [Terriglobales bacterium]